MSTSIGEGDVILKIHVGGFRRMVSITAIIGLGAILVWFGLSAETAGALGKTIFVVCGLAMLALARSYYAATSVGLELTNDELRDTQGRVLCALQDVEIVDRSIFGFKPSNGVSLRLAQPGPVTWQLGLWWQVGRRIGIGGSTAPAQNKAFADAIRLILEDRRLKAEGKPGPFD